MNRSLHILLLLLLAQSCATKTKPNSQQHTNALIKESSPYLLQHAHNPVNWYPWGKEALEKAQKEDKLLIISVGYAACHWCHVMEHESFEDTMVARIMNDNFVSIKVDREERPDVDDVYMTACQLTTKNGCGWPLNAIAFPDGRPIWTGTYLPRDNWMEVLNFFIKEKAKDGTKMEEYAAQIVAGMHNNTIGNTATAELATDAQLQTFADNLMQGIDPQKGGGARAPKFPMPDVFQFLQNYAFYKADKNALALWETTLDHLAAGGIYDQIGGGFARYSTDADWLVPHFEKMAYDNGQLISLFANAYAQTGKERYATVVRQTVAFVNRELSSPQGGFYSSLDADSEGEEGKFYVWTSREIDTLLTPAEAKLVTAYYGVKSSGNWEDGKNILHLDPKATPTTNAALATAQQKLMQARDKRIRPALDDKLLTTWNSLMIHGYAVAATKLQDKDMLARAIKAADYLVEVAMEADGRLWRNYKAGKPTINAFLDDYAFTAQAFISLYEATFDEKWLQRAAKLCDYAIMHFDNPQSELFFYTSDIDPPLVSRRMEVQDNVIASSNSALAEALWKMGALLDRNDYAETSTKMLGTMLHGTDMLEQPFFHANWGQLLLQHLNQPYEVAIVGDNWPDVSGKLQAQYLPNAWFLGGVGELALLKDKAVAGETYVYVCRRKVCKFPVRTVVEALDLIR